MCCERLRAWWCCWNGGLRRCCWRAASARRDAWHTSARTTCSAARVLGGAVLNATAVGRAAAEAAAERGLGIAVVCSGDEGGAAFSLEDALGAGAIVDAVVGLGRATPQLELSDAALAALSLYRAHQGQEHQPEADPPSVESALRSS